MTKNLKIYATLEVEHDQDFDVPDQTCWIEFPIVGRDSMIQALANTMPLVYDRLQSQALRAFAEAKKKHEGEKPTATA